MSALATKRRMAEQIKPTSGDINSDKNVSCTFPQWNPFTHSKLSASKSGKIRKNAVPRLTASPKRVIGLGYRNVRYSFVVANGVGEARQPEHCDDFVTKW